MRIIHVPCTALGLAFALAAPAAHAQNVVAQPPQTVRTVTTTRIVRPIARHRVEVTRRTYVTDRVMPASSTTTTTTTVAPAPAIEETYPAPLYDYVPPTPAPVATAPYYRAPLYDTVVQPAPVVSTTVSAIAASAAPSEAGTAVPFYRYVYQPDRILVIDPNTGIAVQAIPR